MSKKLAVQTLSLVPRVFSRIGREFPWVFVACALRLSVAACVFLSTCTGLLGLALVILGRVRLARFTRCIPLPVTRGYLAFIGCFCGKAGLAFASVVRMKRSTARKTAIVGDID